MQVNNPYDADQEDFNSSDEESDISDQAPSLDSEEMKTHPTLFILLK